MPRIDLGSQAGQTGLYLCKLGAQFLHLEISFFFILYFRRNGWFTVSHGSHERSYRKTTYDGLNGLFSVSILTMHASAIVANNAV